MTTTPTTTAKPLPKLTRRASGNYATEDGRFEVQSNSKKGKRHAYVIFDTATKDEHGFPKIIAHAAYTLRSAQTKIQGFLARGWC